MVGMSLKDNNNNTYPPLLDYNTTSILCKSHTTSTQATNTTSTEPTNATSIESKNSTSIEPNNTTSKNLANRLSSDSDILTSSNEIVLLSVNTDSDNRITRENRHSNSINNISTTNNNDDNINDNKDHMVNDYKNNNDHNKINTPPPLNHQNTTSTAFKSTSSTSNQYIIPSINNFSNISYTDPIYNQQKTKIPHNQLKTEIKHGYYKTDSPQNRYKPETPQTQRKTDQPNNQHSLSIKNTTTPYDTSQKGYKPTSSITKSPSTSSKTGKVKDHPWNRSLSERVKNIGALKRGMKKEKNYKAKEYDVMMTYYWLLHAGYPIFILLHQESHMAQEAQVKSLVEADGFGAQVANSVWRRVSRLNRLIRVNLPLESLKHLRFDDLSFTFHSTLLPQFVDDVLHNNKPDDTSAVPISTTTSSNDGDLGRTQHTKTHSKSLKLKRNSKRLQSKSGNTTPQHSKKFKGIFFSNSLNLSSLKLTFSFLSLSNKSPISGAKLKKMKKSGIKKLFRRMSGSRKYKVSTENVACKNIGSDFNVNDIKPKNCIDTNSDKIKTNDTAPNQRPCDVQPKEDVKEDLNNNEEVRKTNETAGVNINSNRFENLTKNKPWLKNHSDFLVYYTYVKKETLLNSPHHKTKERKCFSAYIDKISEESISKNVCYGNNDAKSNTSTAEKACNDKRFCNNDKTACSSLCNCCSNKYNNNKQNSTTTQDSYVECHNTNLESNPSESTQNNFLRDTIKRKSQKKNVNCRRKELAGIYADLYHQINSLSYNSLNGLSDDDHNDEGGVRDILSKDLIDNQKDRKINFSNKKRNNIHNNFNNNDNKNRNNNNNISKKNNNITNDDNNNNTNDNNNNNNNNNNINSNTSNTSNSYRYVDAGHLYLLQKLSFLRLATLLDIEDSTLNELLLYRPICVQNPTNNIFGLRPQETLRRHGQPIPTCIARAMLWLGHEAIHCVGVFRKPGVRKRTLLMQKKIEEDPEGFDFYDSSPYDVADLLKTYFRLLPESLFPPPFSKLLLHHFPMSSSQKSLIMLQHIVTLLPCENRDLLYILIRFLKEIASHCATNNMNNHSLAVCFAPSLFHGDSTFSSPKTYNKKSIPKNSSKTTFTESLNSSLSQSQNSAKTSNQSTVLQTSNTNIIGQISQPFLSFHHSINFHEASGPSCQQSCEVVRKNSRSHSQASTDHATNNLPLANKSSSNNNESLNDLKLNETPLQNSTAVSNSFLNQSFCKSPRTKASSRFKYFFRSKSNDNIAKEFIENDEHIHQNKVATQIINTLICHHPSIFHVSNEVNCKDFTFLAKRNKDQRKQTVHESGHNGVEEKLDKFNSESISKVLEGVLMEMVDNTEEYKECHTNSDKNIRIYHSNNNLLNSLNKPTSITESSLQNLKKSPKNTSNSPKKLSKYMEFMQQNSFKLDTWLGVVEMSHISSEDVIEMVADHRGDWDEDLTSWEVLRPIESIKQNDDEFVSIKNHKDVLTTRLNGYCEDVIGFKRECSSGMRSLLKNVKTAKTDQVKYNATFSPLPDLSFNVQRARLCNQENTISCLISSNMQHKTTEDTNVELEFYMAVELGASLTRLYHFSRVDLKGHGVRWYEGVYGSMVERSLKKIKEAVENNNQFNHANNN